MSFFFLLPRDKWVHGTSDATVFWTKTWHLPYQKKKNLTSKYITGLLIGQAPKSVNSYTHHLFDEERCSTYHIPSLLVPHSEQNLEVSLKYGAPHSSQYFAGLVGWKRKLGHQLLNETSYKTISQRYKVQGPRIKQGKPNKHKMHKIQLLER